MYIYNIYIYIYISLFSQILWTIVFFSNMLCSLQENPGHPRIVSVLVKGDQPLRPAADGTPVKFKLATNTAVNFLCSHHDLVFAIDVSFSTISSVSALCELSGCLSTRIRPRERLSSFILLLRLVSLAELHPHVWLL